jgi:hypothetical protein
MDISGRVNGVIRGIALWTALGIVILGVVLAAIGFLIAGGYIWLSHRMDHAAAAASLGGGLLAVAVLIALIGGAVIRKSRKRYPSLLTEFSGSIGLAGRLVAMLIRRDPKKALILSIVAGALAEYITNDRKK